MNDRHSKNDSSPEFEADSKQVAEDMNANKSEGCVRLSIVFVEW